MQDAIFRPLKWLAATCRRSIRRPLLHALSCVCVSDANKLHMLAEGDTRVLDACATVLGWGTPGSPVDGGGGSWPPLMVCSSRHARCAAQGTCHGAHVVLLCGSMFLVWPQVRRGKEYCSEVLFQLRCVTACERARVCGAATARCALTQHARATQPLCGRQARAAAARGMHGRAASPCARQRQRGSGGALPRRARGDGRAARCGHDNADRSWV